MIILGVDSAYRRKGIAGELVRMSLEVAKAKGCGGAYVEVSSGFTRRIVEKAGFEEIRRLKWNEIEFKGEFICKGKDFDSDGISSNFILI